MTTEVAPRAIVRIATDTDHVEYINTAGELYTIEALTPEVAGQAIPEIERTIARLMEFRGVGYEKLRAFMEAEQRREFVVPHVDDTSTTYAMKDGEWTMTGLDAAKCREELRPLVDPASLAKAFWDEPVSIVQLCARHRIEGAIVEQLVTCTNFDPDDRQPKTCGQEVTVLKWHHGRITALADKNGAKVAAVIDKYRTRALNVSVAIKK